MNSRSSPDDGLLALFDRLFTLVGRAIGPAIRLALISTAGLFVVWAMVSSFTDTLESSFGWVGLDLAPTLILLLLCWAHGVFIVTLAAKLLNPHRKLLDLFGDQGLRGGMLLAAAIAVFAGLDVAGSSYVCADGSAHGRSFVPMLPWLWIGWFILNLSGVPARLAAPKAAIEGSLIWPEWRMLLLAPMTLPVLLLGLPFQRRIVDCTPPFDNMSFGLFDGGLIALTLLALFWFVASTSMAVIAAACILPEKSQETPA